MARSNEPAVWSLFAGGGMVAAMLMPAHLLILGILVPLGIGHPLNHAAIESLFSNIIVQLYLIVLISLPLFHFAHRLRYALADVGLRPIDLPLAVLLYGVAIAGTVFAVMAVFSV